jgi:uncharacterized membrane protein YkvA (DUF1232 family)
MSEQNAVWVDAFGGYLRTLPADAELIAEAVLDGTQPESVRLPLLSGLSYLLRSIDLMDDSIHTLGYLDDAIVLRLSVARVVGGVPEPLLGLRGDVGQLVDFLSDLAPRFQRFMAGLEEESHRGRPLGELLNDSEALAAFRAEVANFANRYERPTLQPDPRNLVKLRAFLGAKLPV